MLDLDHARAYTIGITKFFKKTQLVKYMNFHGREHDATSLFSLLRNAGSWYAWTVLDMATLIMVKY